MGFDPWSFVFQTINFVVLVLLLTRFVYRPLRRSIDERAARITEREEAASAMQLGVEAKMQEAEARDRRINEEREAILADARDQAAALRARLVAQAEEDAAAARERGEHLLQMERESARDRLGELAIDKSVALASAVLAGLSHEALDEALLAMLLEEVRERLVAEAGAGPRATHGAPHEVELTFARPPPPGAVMGARAALAEALGGKVDLACKEDPSLVAGVVLRLRHEVWDASVAGQLAAFRERARRELDKETAGA